MKPLVHAFFLSLFIFFQLIFPSSSFAHPLDEIGDIKTYDQKQILSLDKDRITLTIEVTLYALDKIKVWESIDKNRDREITPFEKDEWMRKGSQSSWLSIEGKRIDFIATKLEFPSYFEFFSPDPAKFTLKFLAPVSVSANEMIIYYYQGKDQKLEEIDFEARGASGLKVENLTKTTPDSVSFQLAQGQDVTGSILGLTSTSKLEDFLNRYVKNDNLPVSFVILALFSAFAIGALHALTPGHGKAIVAGYLVGSRGTVLHALYLGLIITATHTSVVFILGFLAIFLSQHFVAANIVKSLTFFSGLLVFVFGIYLVITRGMKLVLKTKNREHNDNHHTHSHQISWKNLLPLGLSGGLVPCVDALAILIVAISLGKTFWGIVILIVFSAGLACTLTGAGMLAVLAKEKVVKRYTKLTGYERVISLASAVVVTLLGLGLMLTG